MTKSRNNNQTLLKTIIDDKQSEFAPEWEDSKYFEYIACSEVLKDNDLSIDEIVAGIVGDTHDGGIDAFFLFLNGQPIFEDTELEYDKLKRNKENRIEVHIFQAKKSFGFGENALLKFQSSFEDLFDLEADLDSLSSLYNDELLSLTKKSNQVFSELASSFPSVLFHFHYVTLGDEVDEYIQAKAKKLEEKVANDFNGAECNVTFIGATELLGLLRRSPQQTFQLRFADNPISIENGSYICLAKLTEYFKLITDGNNALQRNLFEANVRDYQGDVVVNKGIRQSLKKPAGEDFWMLNNGVTIICSDADAKGKVVTMRNPQIVNGMQTSYELHEHFKANLDKPDDRKLLVRVIVEADEAGRDRIIHATNNQTTIPASSLHASEKIHRDIEDFLLTKKYYYERKKNFYKNQNKRAANIISIGSLAQAVMSVLLLRPNDARARPSTLLSKPEDYLTVFNNNYNLQIYLNCLKLKKRVEDSLKQNSASYGLSSKDVINVKFHILMVLALRLAKKKTNMSPKDIVALSVDVSDELLKECSEYTRDIFHILGGSDKIAKGPKLVDELKAQLVIK